MWTELTALLPLLNPPGVAIYEAVREQVDACQTELKGMEEAVKEQLSGKPKKKKKKKKSTGKKAAAAAAAAATASMLGDVELHLGNVDEMEFNLDDIPTDDEDDAAGLLDFG